MIDPFPHSPPNLFFSSPSLFPIPFRAMPRCKKKNHPQVLAYAPYFKEIYIYLYRFAKVIFFLSRLCLHPQAVTVTPKLYEVQLACKQSVPFSYLQQLSTSLPSPQRSLVPARQKGCCSEDLKPWMASFTLTTPSGSQFSRCVPHWESRGQALLISSLSRDTSVGISTVSGKKTGK